MLIQEDIYYFISRPGNLKEEAVHVHFMLFIIADMEI